MRFYKGQHAFYCAVDLHAKTMHVCLVNQAGEVLVHRNLKRARLPGAASAHCAPVPPGPTTPARERASGMRSDDSAGAPLAIDGSSSVSSGRPPSARRAWRRALASNGSKSTPLGASQLRGALSPAKSTPTVGRSASAR